MNYFYEVMRFKGVSAARLVWKIKYLQSVHCIKYAEYGFLLFCILPYKDKIVHNHRHFIFMCPSSKALSVVVGGRPVRSNFPTLMSYYLCLEYLKFSRNRSRVTNFTLFDLYKKWKIDNRDNVKVSVNRRSRVTGRQLSEAYSEPCETSKMNLHLRCLTWFCVRLWLHTRNEILL